MNGDNLIGNERVLISQFLSEKDAHHTHTHKWVCCWTELSRDRRRYIHEDRTTPQSGHYPITGWAHASRDSNFNCSCILIGIMRLTTDTHTHIHIYRRIFCQHWAEGDLYWQWYKYLKWSINRWFWPRPVSFRCCSFSLSLLLKSGIFTWICDCCFLFRMCQLCWHVSNISSIF